MFTHLADYPAGVITQVSGAFLDADELSTDARQRVAAACRELLALDVHELDDALSALLELAELPAEDARPILAALAGGH